MSEAIIVDPCLGPEGWTTNEYEVGVKKFIRYYLSHRSQSVVYGDVPSIHNDIALAGNDLDDLIDRIQNSLERLYDDAFESSNVKVTIKPGERKGGVIVAIAISFGTNKIYDLSYGLSSPFSDHELVEYSNSGTLERLKQ